MALHRADVIAALLTLARAWYAAGQPPAQGIPALATFTGWAKTVGGILAHAGVPGFLTNLEHLYAEADEESAQWEAFLEAWYGTFGSESISTAYVMAHLTETTLAGSAEKTAGSALSETLPESLQLALKDKPTSFAIKLGKALQMRVDTCFGDRNWHLSKGKDTHNKQKLWRVSAGSAGSVHSHAQENLESLSAVDKEGQQEKQEHKNGMQNYPHYPHASQEHDDPSPYDVLQAGSKGQMSLVSKSGRNVMGSSGEAALPAELPATLSPSSDIPSEDHLRELYTAVKSLLPREAPHGSLVWKVPGSGFEVGPVSHEEYCRRLLVCCKSADVSRRQAAQAEMQAWLGLADA